jgi:hypothetical protein
MLQRLLLFLLLLMPPTAGAQMVVRDSVGIYAVGRHAQICEVVRQTLPPQTLPAGIDTFRFQPADRAPMQLMTVSKAYWLRFTVKNETGRKLYLFIPNYGLRTLRFYQVAKGSVVAEHTGGMIPWDAREYPNNHTIFDFNIPPGQTQTGYIYLEEPPNARVQALVMAEPSLLHFLHLVNLLDGIYIGLSCLFSSTTSSSLSSSASATTLFTRSLCLHPPALFS